MSGSLSLMASPHYTDGPDNVSVTVSVTHNTNLHNTAPAIKMTENRSPIWVALCFSRALDIGCNRKRPPSPRGCVCTHLVPGHHPQTVYHPSDRTRTAHNPQPHAVHSWLTNTTVWGKKKKKRIEQSQGSGNFFYYFSVFMWSTFSFPPICQ